MLPIQLVPIDNKHEALPSIRSMNYLEVKYLWSESDEVRRFLCILRHQAFALAPVSE